MKSSCKSLDVFEFKGDEELDFPAPTKKMNPKFVEYGGSGTKTFSLKGDLLLRFSRDQQFVSSERRPDSICDQLNPRVLSTEATALMDETLNCASPKSESCDEADDVFADAYESPSESSPPSSSYTPGDNGIYSSEGHESSPDGCFGIVQKLGDRNVILVSPDYIVYQGSYSTESVLIFSKTSFKLMDSAKHGDQGISRFEWETDDIVDIQSQWCRRLEIAKVKIRLLPKVAEDLLVEEMQFAVGDMNWPEKQEIIMSLNERYKALWNVVVDTELERDGRVLSGNNENIWRKPYFPKFVDSFDEVVYPKGDPDAVTISKRDVDLLQPDIFVNDTIIDFYIKYLQNQMPLEKRNRFHFFNSFFFRKLIDLDKDPYSSFESKGAFQRVRKWTRKVNLFKKDYVFIPVNYSYHWSLIVICHPGEVIKSQDEDVEKSPKVPCILHMDSMKGSHTVLKDVVQSYLSEEWKEKNKDTSDDIFPDFSNLRFVSLELPQQPNAYDCGLFLLHYVECFLEQAPINFSPSKITRYSRFLNVDWFRPEEPCLKRAEIQRLICNILEEENSPDACSSKPCDLNNPESIEVVSALEFISKRSGPSQSIHGTLSASQAREGIGITLLHTSSSQCGDDSSVVLREFLEAEATGPFLDEQHQTFEQAATFGAMGLMQQNDVEACGQIAYTGSHVNPDSAFYLSDNLRADSPAGERYDFEQYPETSICGSGYSVIEIQEIDSSGKTHIIEEKPDEPMPSSAEDLISAPDQMLNVAESDSCDHILSCDGSADKDRNTFKLLKFTSQQDCNTEEKEDVASQDIDVVQETLASEINKQQNTETVLKITGETDEIEKGSFGGDLVSESDGKLVAKRGGEYLLPESEEQHPAKKLRLDSSAEFGVETAREDP